MKKLLALTLSVVSVGFIALPVEAKVTEPSNTSTVTITKNTVTPQVRIQIGRGNRRNNRRVITRTRLIRVGNRLYRETYQLRYLSNGRYTTRIISRVRVR